MDVMSCTCCSSYEQIFHRHHASSYEAIVSEEHVEKFRSQPLKVLDILEAEQFLAEVLSGKHQVDQSTIQSSFISGLVEESVMLQTDDSCVLGEDKLNNTSRSQFIVPETQLVDVSFRTPAAMVTHQYSRPIVSSPFVSPIGPMCLNMSLSDRPEDDEEDLTTTVARNKLRQEVDDVFSMMSQGKLTQSLDHFEEDCNSMTHSPSPSVMELNKAVNVSNPQDETRLSTTCCGQNIYESKLSDTTYVELKGGHFSPMTFDDMMEDDDFDNQSMDSNSVPIPQTRLSNSVLSINFKVNDQSRNDYTFCHTPRLSSEGTAEEPIAASFSLRLSESQDMNSPKDTKSSQELNETAPANQSLLNTKSMKRVEEITPLHTRRSFNYAKHTCAPVAPAVPLNDTIEEFMDSPFQNAQAQQDSICYTAPTAPSTWLDKLRMSSLQSQPNKTETSGKGGKKKRSKSQVEKKKLPFL